MDWTRLPLSRATVDRAALRRADARTLVDGWSDPRTRVLLLHEGRLAVVGDGDEVRLDLRRPADLGPLAPDRAPDGVLRLYLGEDEEAAYQAVVLPDTAWAGTGTVDIEGVPTSADDLVGRLVWSTLRDVGHALGDRDAGLAATAVGLAAWHERHPRCARCGARTEAELSGWTRRCTEDGSEHYPRTDPAVIMAVIDAEDRLLLGHAPHWPERRFSTLAGYVEPGESLEGAVRREVAEEVGVVVGEVAYRGSQPWPFPASLMLAFVARATTTELRLDDEEITEARWFTREELTAAVRTGEVLLPMRTSVARALIEDWLGERIGGE
ncbi:NUDIX hydrolase [Actinotalea ferrariae CF5-4]|uniref:NAD(+) diphosphatase n=1 Tax=Actinotalea ferrariae CF5-4 TaxID=948458 RepID=A0A021VTQ7_9CELL|nr:NAD(+) diphosphatase [Actinotalea ferrariae]EYR63415.1 NUDIX hydrolase [Actinotalea ferrariae CF5-4]